MVVLLQVFDRRLRWCVAVLWLVGTGLAGMSAVLAVTRLGTGEAAAFSVVAIATTFLAVAVLRAARWSLWLSVVVLGGQVGGVAGTIWELAVGVDATKAAELRRLGFDPVAGVAINLIYSALAVVLFGWLALRWSRLRRTQPGGAAGRGVAG